MRKHIAVTIAALAFVVSPLAFGSDDAGMKAELEKIKKEVEALRKERAGAKPVAAAAADQIVENKYGPNATVKTKEGALTIGGLIQVWYYNIQNDNNGFLGDLPGRTGGDANDMADNDGFRIRRAEISFNVAIHENVSAVIMIDPARELTGFPSFNTNQGLSRRYMYDHTHESSAESGRLLKDAYINFHGILPHHDTTIGQFKPYIGLEGIAPSSSLDFVERSMIGQLLDERDLGMTTHGTWWDDRFQYWLGAFNSNGNMLQANFSNKADDNDELSFVYRVLVRPIWREETWGSLELGASSQFNRRGEGYTPPGGDGLNRPLTWAIRHYAWLSYAAGGPAKGAWLKAEYAWIKDRFDPYSAGAGTWGAATWTYEGDAIFANGSSQSYPKPYHTDGWYVAAGYRLDEGVFKDDLPKILQPVEFAFRYETYGNMQLSRASESEATQNRSTDVWRTTVWTAGINYYLKGNNAKVQVNYSVADEPQNGHQVLHGDGAPRRAVREVHNNSLVVNFQVAW